jgi:GT2 family glycosyltransferase
MYLEDTDFCRRINQYYRTIYYPKVSIIHGYSKASYTSFKLMKHHLQSSIKYFNKWGWFFDKDRNQINRVVLNNELLPAMEKARAEKRDRQFNRPVKNKPLVTPAKILQPFSVLNKSENDYTITLEEQTIVA